MEQKYYFWTTLLIMSCIIALNQPARNIGSQLNELIYVLKNIEQSSTKEEIIFDFKNISFVHPLSILSLAALFYELPKKKYTTEKEADADGWKKLNTNLKMYLDTIFFPEGFRPDESEKWRKILSKYEGKTYIPIVNFPASRQTEKTEIRNNVLSQINSLLGNNLKFNIQCKTAVSYLISEMTDNIVDHSGVIRGWVFAQYYPRGEYLDVCIIDTGKTILGSYKKAGLTIKNDAEAILEAVKGKSTKDNGKERGRGFLTSRNMIIEGLKGDFVLLSGKAALINKKVFTLPVKWKGTVLALRIPKNNKGFDYRNYI